MIKIENYWSLIEEGKFREAFDKLKQQYNDYKHNGYPLGNLVIASFLVKDYESALHYDTISEESELIDAGAALWSLGRFNEAVEMWRRGNEKPYTSNIVTIPTLLYFASVHQKDEKLQKESVRLLKKRWKSRNELAGFLLDEIAEEQLIESVSTGPLRTRNRCKVEFYLGTKCLQNGNEQGYIKHLQKCKKLKGNYLEIEYFIAVSELDRLINKK